MRTIVVVIACLLSTSYAGFGGVSQISGMRQLKLLLLERGPMLRVREQLKMTDAADAEEQAKAQILAEFGPEVVGQIESAVQANPTDVRDAKANPWDLQQTDNMSEEQARAAILAQFGPEVVADLDARFKGAAMPNQPMKAYDPNMTEEEAKAEMMRLFGPEVVAQMEKRFQAGGNGQPRPEFNKLSEKQAKAPISPAEMTEEQAKAQIAAQFGPEMVELLDAQMKGKPIMGTLPQKGSLTEEQAKAELLSQFGPEVVARLEKKFNGDQAIKARPDYDNMTEEEAKAEMLARFGPEVVADLDAKFKGQQAAKAPVDTVSEEQAKAQILAQFGPEMVAQLQAVMDAKAGSGNGQADQQELSAMDLEFMKDLDLKPKPEVE